MKRIPLICANWKMNKTLQESVEYLQDLMKKEKQYKEVEILLLPSLVSLASLSELKGKSHIQLGVQNAYYGQNGPFTGEVSPSQIEGYADYLLIGHSERIRFFHETDELVAKKIQYVTENHTITPILCIGETMDIRKSGKTKEYLQEKLQTILKQVKKENLHNMVIAYEPYWAISDGVSLKVTPKAEEIEEIATLLRDILASIYVKEIADNTRILYGGSVNRENASEFIHLKDIDGFLIGVASLDVHHFEEIIQKSL